MPELIYLHVEHSSIVTPPKNGWTSGVNPIYGLTPEVHPYIVNCGNHRLFLHNHKLNRSPMLLLLMKLTSYLLKF